MRKATRKATDAEILAAKKRKAKAEIHARTRQTVDALANGGNVAHRRGWKNGERINGRVPSAAAVAPRPRHRLGLAAAGAGAAGAGAAAGAYRAKRQGEAEIVDDCNKRLRKECKFSCMKDYKIGSQKRCDKCIGDNEKDCTEEEIIKFKNDKGYNKMRTGTFFDSKPGSDTHQYLPSDPAVVKKYSRKYLPETDSDTRLHLPSDPAEVEELASRYLPKPVDPEPLPAPATAVEPATPAPTTPVEQTQIFNVLPDVIKGNPYYNKIEKIPPGLFEKKYAGGGRKKRKKTKRHRKSKRSKRSKRTRRR